MNKRHLYILTLIFFLLGGLPFLFKLFVFGFPLTADETVNVWNVEARVRFEALNKPVKASIFIPRNTQHHVISGENFIPRGYGLTTNTEEGNRHAVWSIRKAGGAQVLYYKATIRRMKREEPPIKIKKPQIESPGFEGPDLAAADSVLSEIRARSADVRTLVTELIIMLNQPKSGDNISLLLGRQTSIMKKMELAVRILAHESIPARIVHGIQLQELQRESNILHWLEVYDNNSWHSFNPQSGIAKIPDDYLPWWRSTWPIAKITGADKLIVRLSVNLNKEAALFGAIERGRVLAPFFFDFSLFSLPIETQTVYHILLLIPIGAFILVIVRNVIGVKTFGTFMPVLIAPGLSRNAAVMGHFFVFCDHSCRVEYPFLFRAVKTAFSTTTRIHLNGSCPAHGLHECYKPQARSGKRTVYCTLPNGYLDNDHRAHVYCVGGTRCKRSPSAGNRKPFCCRSGLYGYDKQVC